MSITILKPRPVTLADLVNPQGKPLVSVPPAQEREQDVINRARLSGRDVTVLRPAPAVLHAKGVGLDFERHWEEAAEFEYRRAKQIASGESFIGGGAAPGSWTFTNGGRTKLLDGTFDIDSDTYKMAIFLSTSNIAAGSTTFAGCTNESGTSNTGYTAGGVAQALTLAGTTTVTVAASASPSWTAGTSTLIARWIAIYEVGGNILVFALADSAPADVTTQNTGVFTVTTTGSIFTLA